MEYILSKKGESFIRKKCVEIGNKIFTGSHNYHLFRSIPEIPPNYVWIASPKDDNDNLITTPTQYADSLILWFNEYGKKYEINANIIAAQAYHESGYIPWNFPLNGTASGISQFTMETVHNIIINNRDGSFVNDEINALLLNLPNSGRDLSVFNTQSGGLGRYNRATLHQNISNNPKIMIKAQCSYMNIIANRCGNLASSALFGYNAGPFAVINNQQVVTDNYNNTLRLSKMKFSDSKFNEAIKYVEKIFKTAFYDFDVVDLKMDESFKDFSVNLS